MASCVLRNLIPLSSRISTIHCRNATCSWKLNHRFISTGILKLSQRKYTDKHEWVDVNGNVGTIGITNYAQEALGDIVYAQLPDVGTEFSQMDECGALESVKAASELYSPISGKVVETNALVEDQPGLINKKCYEEGWLFKMEIGKPSEIDDLLDEESYNSLLKQEEE